MLLLKLEHEKELEKMKYRKEQLKLDLEMQNVALIKEGKMSASALDEEPIHSRLMWPVI